MTPNPRLGFGVVGYWGGFFGAIAWLHRVASGLPRALSNAATAAVIAAAAAGKDLVDDACAKKAVAELTRD